MAEQGIYLLQCPDWPLDILILSVQLSAEIHNETRLLGRESELKIFTTQITRCHYSVQTCRLSSYLCPHAPVPFVRAFHVSMLYETENVWLKFGNIGAVWGWEAEQAGALISTLQKHLWLPSCLLFPAEPQVTAMSCFYCTLTTAAGFKYEHLIWKSK